VGAAGRKGWLPASRTGTPPVETLHGFFRTGGCRR